MQFKGSTSQGAARFYGNAPLLLCIRAPVLKAPLQAANTCLYSCVLVERCLMEGLKYPFDSQLILRTKKKIRRELLAENEQRIRKHIAVLGGSTTSEIRNILELFLLDQGIEPVFYESEYNRYWQDVMFANPVLEEFAPDIIYIHTTSRNINTFPEITDSADIIDEKLNAVYDPFQQMWEKIAELYQIGRAHV